MSRRFWVLLLLSLTLLLCAAGITAYQLAIRKISTVILQTLGPQANIKQVRLGWNRVYVDSVRVKSTKGWPADDEFRAKTAIIAPDLRTIFSKKLTIGSIAFFDSYLSLIRTAEGAIIVTPHLFSTVSSSGPPPKKVRIHSISFRQSNIDFFDYSVSPFPLHQRFERVQSDFSNFIFPIQSRKIRFSSSGIMVGKDRNGNVQINGWVNLKTNDASFISKISAADLITVQQYFLKPGESGFKKGILNMNLRTDITNDNLNAPGTLLLTDLELAPQSKTSNTVMGIPDDIVVKYLQDQHNKIKLDFTLQGKVSDPKFSLNNAIYQNIARSMLNSIRKDYLDTLKNRGNKEKRKVDSIWRSLKDIF